MKHILDFSRRELAEAITENAVAALRMWDEEAAGMAYEVLPDYMIPGLTRYMLLGFRPGSFLTSVLENDLVRAASRADENNRPLIGAYGIWLHLYAPEFSYGSVERVNGWIDRAGIHGGYNFSGGAG